MYGPNKCYKIYYIFYDLDTCENNMNITKSTLFLLLPLNLSVIYKDTSVSNLIMLFIKTYQGTNMSICEIYSHTAYILMIALSSWGLQGVPKRMLLLSGFEFLTLGGVFLGVKNNSKNFGNQKNIGLFSKILSK